MIPRILSRDSKSSIRSSWLVIRKATTVPGFERLETIQKFQQLLRITDKQQFESDQEPYQSVDILRRLRVDIDLLCVEILDGGWILVRCVARRGEECGYDRGGENRCAAAARAVKRAHHGWLAFGLPFVVRS